jgi:putative phage-type endonuclease
MSYRVIRPATHEDWLAERAKGIGSSDAGTVMGASPFQTPYGLYLLKTGRAEPIKESDAMFNGHILEGAVAEWFAAKTGAIVDITTEGDWIAADTQRDYLRVSPDRLYWPKGTPASAQTAENARVLEIKSTSKIVDKDDLPDYWYCQIQYQMGILGASSGTLCWISGSPTLHFDRAEVEFNRAFYDAMIERIDRFWTENILKDVAPADTCAADTLRRYPQSKSGLTAEADDKTYALWQSLKDCRSELKTLEEREETLTDALKMALGEAETLTRTDSGTGEVRTLATWKSALRESFDEERLKKDSPETWMEYCRTETTVALDRKALQKALPDLYARYSAKSPAGRKFLVK